MRDDMQRIRKKLRLIFSIKGKQRRLPFYPASTKINHPCMTSRPNDLAFWVP
jgi:hypothetical protein